MNFCYPEIVVSILYLATRFPDSSHAFRVFFVLQVVTLANEYYGASVPFLSYPQIKACTRGTTEVIRMNFTTTEEVRQKWANLKE